MYGRFFISRKILLKHSTSTEWSCFNVMFGWLAVILHLFCCLPSSPSRCRHPRQSALKTRKFIDQKIVGRAQLGLRFDESDIVSNYEITITSRTNLTQWHLHLKSIIQSCYPFPSSWGFKIFDSVAFPTFFCNRKRIFTRLDVLLQLYPPILVKSSDTKSSLGGRTHMNRKTQKEFRFADISGVDDRGKAKKAKKKSDDLLDDKNSSFFAASYVSAGTRGEGKAIKTLKHRQAFPCRR